MGQVPAFKILVLGGGRVSLHWSHYLRALGFDVTTCPTSGQRPYSLPTLDPSSVYNLVFLGLPDKALSDFYLKHLTAFSGPVVHFSGSFPHPEMLGCHPLCTFSKDLYDFDFYKTIPLVFDRPSEHIARNFWAKLPNPQYHVSQKNRALYHSLCVLSANLPQLLWKQCQEQMNLLGLPAGVLSPLLTKTLKNFISDPDGCLTGPLVRGDQETLERGLKALSGHPLQTFYKEAFSLFSRPGDGSPPADDNSGRSSISQKFSKNQKLSKNHYRPTEVP